MFWSPPKMHPPNHHFEVLERRLSTNLSGRFAENSLALSEKKTSLKLTADVTWKWMVGRWNFLLRLAWLACFQGRTVSFRDGKPVEVGMLLPPFTSFDILNVQHLQRAEKFIGKETFQVKQLRLAYISPTYLCSKGIYPINTHYTRCIWSWLLRVPSQWYHHFSHYLHPREPKTKTTKGTFESMIFGLSPGEMCNFFLEGICFLCLQHSQGERNKSVTPEATWAFSGKNNVLHGLRYPRCSHRSAFLCPCAGWGHRNSAPGWCDWMVWLDGSLRMGGTVEAGGFLGTS